jgi:hypothetical protein
MQIEITKKPRQDAAGGRGKKRQPKKNKLSSKSKDGLKRSSK